MLAFLSVLSCSMISSMLVGGVVVEQHQQDDDYDSTNTDKYNCPDTDKDGIGLHEGHKTIPNYAKQMTFMKYLSSTTADRQPMKPRSQIINALKKFLFDRDTADTVPKLFTNGFLNIGDNTSCGAYQNWSPIAPAQLYGSVDIPEWYNQFQCAACGYPVTQEIRQDIVNWVTEWNPEAAVNVDDIPKFWCHNPMPVIDTIDQEYWAKTGGYFNVLKCDKSQYSVIGFAAERPGTCYPYHTHKSYELYWPIGGQAEWKTPPSYKSIHSGGPAGGFPNYTANGTLFALHKHDPEIQHEIQTTTQHTVQVYFWSMTAGDQFGHAMNNYSHNIGFAAGGKEFTPAEAAIETSYGGKSCYWTSRGVNSLARNIGKAVGKWLRL